MTAQAPVVAVETTQWNHFLVHGPYEDIPRPSAGAVQ
jgi:hypothetical protein